jgi:hypothetical protein
VPDDLLATAIEAAGGQKLWNTLRSLTIDLSIGGPLWTMNGWPPGATFNQPMTLNTVDERNECTMLVPNHLERDTAIRVPGGDGRVDSVSELKPVETFSGEAVIERVHRS